MKKRLFPLIILLLLLLTTIPVSAVTLQKRTITPRTKKLTMVVSERLKPVMKGKTIKWSSNKKSIVTVSSGIWTAKARGIATLTGKYGKNTIKIKVTVEKPIITRKQVTIYVGNQARLRIVGTTQPVKWKTKNKTIASVDSNGVVTGRKKGTTIVYATVRGISYQCKITVKKKPAPAVVTPAPAPVVVTPIPVSAGYVLNTNTMKFHYSWCSSVSEMSYRNRQDSYDSRESIIARGYVPCKRCNP